MKDKLSIKKTDLLTQLENQLIEKKYLRLGQTDNEIILFFDKSPKNEFVTLAHGADGILLSATLKNPKKGLYKFVVKLFTAENKTLTARQVEIEKMGHKLLESHSFSLNVGGITLLCMERLGQTSFLKLMSAGSNNIRLRFIRENLSNDNLFLFYAQALRQMVVLAKHGYVHGDIDASNIVLNLTHKNPRLGLEGIARMVDFSNMTKIGERYLQHGKETLIHPERYEYYYTDQHCEEGCQPPIAQEYHATYEFALTMLHILYLDYLNKDTDAPFKLYDSHEAIVTEKRFDFEESFSTSPFGNILIRMLGLAWDITDNLSTFAEAEEAYIRACGGAYKAVDVYPDIIISDSDSIASPPPADRAASQAISRRGSSCSSLGCETPTPTTFSSKDAAIINETHGSFFTSKSGTIYIKNKPTHTKDDLELLEPTPAMEKSLDVLPQARPSSR